MARKIAHDMAYILLLAVLMLSQMSVFCQAQDTSALEEGDIHAPEDSLTATDGEENISPADFPMPAAVYVEITRPLPEQSAEEQVSARTEPLFSTRTIVLAVLAVILILIVLVRNILALREPAFHETAERVLDDLPEKEPAPIDPTGFEIVEEENVSCDLSTPYGRASALKTRRKTNEREIKRLLAKL